MRIPLSLLHTGDNSFHVRAGLLLPYSVFKERHKNDAFVSRRRPALPRLSLWTRSVAMSSGNR